MTRSKRREPTRKARRVRDGAVGALGNLRATATNGARRIGDGSRRRKDTAQRRASDAAMVLRGRTPRSAIRRWLGAGLAAGAVIGAAGAAAVGRRRHHDASHGTGSENGVREKAGSAVETVRERATTVAHRAATSTRDTAAKLSEATKPRPDDSGVTASKPTGNGQRAHKSAGSTTPGR